VKAWWKAFCTWRARVALAEADAATTIILARCRDGSITEADIEPVHRALDRAERWQLRA